MNNIENHPFEAFVPANASILIIGSFPGKEQTQIKADENQWFYGAKRNQFWKILSNVYNVELNTKNDKIELFAKNNIAITDLFSQVIRHKDSNLDSNLEVISYNKSVIKSILENNNIKKILFTSKFVEKKFMLLFPDIKYIANLPSPSNATNISISKMKDYLEFKETHENSTIKSYKIYMYNKLLKQ